MFATIFKDSAASKKAWLTRRGGAQPAAGAPTPLKSRVGPDGKNEPKVMSLQMYMEGFYSKLKDKQERKYVEERARQMTMGEARPKGLSGRFGLSKERAIALEVVTYKIFKAGRAKFNV